MRYSRNKVTGDYMKTLKKDGIYYAFLIPSVILFVFAFLYPFVTGVNIAFTDWDGISAEYNYIGLKNFFDIFKDTTIRKAIANTLIFAVGYTAINNVLALGLAVLLNQKFKGQNFCKTVFFIPMALSAVLASFLWTFIDSKIYATFLSPSGRSILGNPSTVLLGIIILGLWNAIGSNIMIYIAGLTNIPADYYEAAAIDGASGWKRFRYIILPLLGPSFTMCITLTLTSSLREFATVMAATGGGPANSSETVAIFIYKNLFQYYKAGYGQAVAIIFMVLLMVIGISLQRFFRSKEVEM